MHKPESAKFCDCPPKLFTRVCPPSDATILLRRMFGSHDIFCDEVMFVIADEIFLSQGRRREPKGF